jgi:threonine synthase
MERGKGDTVKWISTRGKSVPLTTSQALKQGLASDGGLFVAEKEPEIKIDPSWSDLDFADFAARFLAPFFEGDPLEKKLPDLCRKAFNFPVPLKNISADTRVLELFHGPTSAFKDFGARFLALALDAIPGTSKKEKMVLVATSGDTGGAVAAAFCECTEIPVVILYPQGKISPRQEKQLTCWGPQVRAFAVKGDFDDCQRIAKEAFQSEEWTSRFELISANSINIGRLLPQMAYFAYTSLRFQTENGEAAGFIIPSGNLGNAVAALWAQRLGFPLKKIILAHNANSAVADYFKSGVWASQATKATLANAMDVGNPSNFERAAYFYPRWEDFKKVADAQSVSDEQIKQTVKRGFLEDQEIWCPHTATAAFIRKQQPSGKWILVATAHPAKFESIVEPLIGTTVKVPEKLQTLLLKNSVKKEILPTLSELSQNI